MQADQSQWLSVRLQVGRMDGRASVLHQENAALIGS
jgi:hypothetical protein